MFTIYSQPNCGPCIGLISGLKRRGIPHSVVDIRTDAAGRERMERLGGTGTPFTVNEETGMSWQGVYPDRYTTTVELSRAG